MRKIDKIYGKYENLLKIWTWNFELNSIVEKKIEKICRKMESWDGYGEILRKMVNLRWEWKNMKENGIFEMRIGKYEGKWKVDMDMGKNDGKWKIWHEYGETWRKIKCWDGNW